MHQLADHAWTEFLEQQPLWATLQGIETWDDRLDDPSAQGRERQMAMVRGWAAQAEALSASDLTVEDEVTLGLLRAVVRRFERAHELRLWQLEALDQNDGPQALPGMLARFARTDTPERLERLLRRLEAYPAWVAAHQANTAEGVAAGRTAPAPVVERCIAQTRRLAEAPADESPLMVADRELDEAGRARLREAVTEHVQPALATWLAVLEDYVAHVRPGDGLCYLSDGEAVYRAMIERYTNLDEEPQAIHDYGLARLDEIGSRVLRSGLRHEYRRRPA
jgi:uncharacterized protein (DUF885 family)